MSQTASRTGLRTMQSAPAKVYADAAYRPEENWNGIGYVIATHNGRMFDRRYKAVPDRYGEGSDLKSTEAEFYALEYAMNQVASIDNITHAKFFTDCGAIVDRYNELPTKRFDYCTLEWVSREHPLQEAAHFTAGFAIEGEP